MLTKDRISPGRHDDHAALTTASGLAAGIGIGAGVGAVLDNLALGVGMGVATAVFVGAAWAIEWRSRRS